jgi:hypothetical protein
MQHTIRAVESILDNSSREHGHETSRVVEVSQSCVCLIIQNQTENNLL